LIGLILFLYTIVLIVLFFYSFHSFILLYLHLRYRKHKEGNTNYKNLSEYPQVTIQLPVYNEKYVVRRLIESVTMLEYPKDKMEIQILDDSDDETSEIISKIVLYKSAQGFDIKHIRREKREGFKAGALQYGLERAKGEFIAIFDADFVPPHDFLLKLLPEFGDPYVGVVQARWGHLNQDESLLTKSQAISLDNHFINEQGLRSCAGFFINFNGTCGIWRKSAIIDGGGWSGDTLAEDLDLSYRIQLKGWRIKYREDVVVPGELPDDVDSFRIQQNRWAKGTFQVGMKLLKKVLKSDLKLMTKYEAIVHLTCHINFVAMFLMGLLSFPIIFFKVERVVSEGYYNFISLFTIGAFGYPLLFLISQKSIYSDYKRRIIYILGTIGYSMGLSISNTKALLEAVLNKNIIFVRTPKSGGTRHKYSSKGNSLIPLLEIAFGLYIFFTFLYAVANEQYAISPFLFIYGFGFLNLGFSSIKDRFVLLKHQEVLCSRENS